MIDEKYDEINEHNKNSTASVGYKDLLAELISVIDLLQGGYNWGGSEDGDGALMNGEPDFDEARKKITEIVSKKSL